MRPIPIVLALMVAFTLPILPYSNLVFAHSERPWRPSGVVPPTGRVPTDPPADPNGGGGSDGGGGGGHGGVTPGPGPFRPDLPRAFSRTRPQATTGNTGRGGVTPGARTRRNSGAAGFERWEWWWLFNRDPYLGLRARLAETAPVTGSSDWLFGRNRKDEGIETEQVTRRAVQEKILPTLLEALGDSHFDVRASAVIALGKVGDRAVLPDLVRGLADTNQLVSEAAALAIGMLREPAGIGVLRDLLRDTAEGRRLVARPAGVPTRTRAFAAVGLGLVGEASVVDDLLAIADPKVQHASLDLPICAVVGLGMMGENAREAVTSLGALLVDPNADGLVRSYVATSLGKIGDPSSVPILRRALRDDDVQVRRSAVIALGRIADSGDTLTVRMLWALVTKGDDLQARNWGCISLGKIGGPEAEKILKQVVVEETGTLRSFGALGLAILAREHGATDVAPYLRAGLDDAVDPSLQGAFVTALGIVGDAASRERLVGILRSAGEPALRGHAAVALGMMNARDVRPEIRALVRERNVDPELQRELAIALGLMGDREAVRILTEALRRAGNDFIRGSITLALGHVGDASAVEVLAAMALDRKGTVDATRSQAVAALGLLGEDEPIPVLRAISIDNNYRAMVDSIALLVRII